MNVFFGKMNDAQQCANFICTGGSGIGYFGGIQPNDYVFIRLAEDGPKLNRLWRFINIDLDQDGKSTAHFEEVFTFNEVSIDDFSRLTFFKLGLTLGNKVWKQSKSVGFFKIELSDNLLFENSVINVATFNNFLSNTDNYRKIKFITDQNDAHSDKDIQICQSGNSFSIFNSDKDFLTEFQINFNADRYTEYLEFLSNNPNEKPTRSRKKVKNWLESNGTTEDLKIVDLWDFFCSKQDFKVNESDEDESQFDNENQRMSYFLITAIKEQGFTFEEMAINSTEEFSYLNEKGNKRQIPRNFKNAKQGDKLICYDGRPSQKAVALAEIIENKDGDYIKLKKTHNFANHIKYEDLINIEVMKDSEYLTANRGTLFKLTKEQYDAILSLSRTITNNLSYEKVGYNKIFYGLPGCGKSYKINNEILKDVPDRFYIRTTFYEDYSYSDFIGQIFPTTKLDNNANKILTYEFKPGPFFDALKKAYEMPNETIYLVIEELNRGNAPSIFGDLFQLLDRNEIGESQYPITSRLISDNLISLPLTQGGKIFLPKNLVILATMNTSDQNVFTLDTAFKRRWEFEEIKNDFSNHPYAIKFVPGTNVTWKKFNETINNVIVNLQTTTSSSEDKRLGAYFVTVNELSSLENSMDIGTAMKFAYKVLEYLWDDVARFNRTDIFKPEYKTLTQLIDAFLGNAKLDIFVETIKFEHGN